MSQKKTSDHRAEPTHSTRYNIAAIRSLIRDAFMTGELERFCQDRPIFRSVLRYLSSSPSLEEMADVLIEYCQTRLLFPELLSEMREFNPRQYERYQARLRDICGPAKTGLEYQAPSQDILRELQGEPHCKDILIVYESDEPDVPEGSAFPPSILFSNGDWSNYTTIVDGCTVVGFSTVTTEQMNHWWSDPVFT